MKRENQYLKPELELSQQVNYLAVVLMDLAGNDKPSEEDIQKLERSLKSMIKKISPLH